MSGRLRILSVLLAMTASIVHANESEMKRQRHPVALALLAEGKQLVTVNERSGSLSLLDVTNRKVLQETTVGKSLADLAVAPSRPMLLVVDHATHELLAVQTSTDRFEVTRRLQVRPYPVTVRISADGTMAFVASLWSRSLTIVNLQTWLDSPSSGSAMISKEIRLPFAPREMLFLDAERKLIVADAFGPRLAVIDPTTASVDSVREIPAHGIRQMRLHPSGDRVLMTHQLISWSAHTTFDDVHWGVLMVNCLRSLPVSELVNPKADPIKAGQLQYLGGPERGAGDPAGFVLRTKTHVAVALAGTDEVLFTEEGRIVDERVKIGEGPTAMVAAADGSRAYIANSFGDSVSIVDLVGKTSIATVSLGPSSELTPADRGERLFHNARLSHDRWFSCSSCHIDGHTNGLLNDNMTDGSFGTAKRVPSLRGVADTAPYAWSGRFKTLSEQIRHSAKSTMQGDELSDEQVGDLESYLSTLAPAPPVGDADQSAAERGAGLFEKLDCRSCHAPPTLTSPRVADVKLKDERGNATFNPPSLRGVSQNAPYFHDGRAPTLSDVLSRFRHQLDDPLTDEQIRDLVAYLGTL